MREDKTTYDSHGDMIEVNPKSWTQLKGSLQYLSHSDYLVIAAVIPKYLSQRLLTQVPVPTATSRLLDVKLEELFDKKFMESI